MKNFFTLAKKDLIYFTRHKKRFLKYYLVRLEKEYMKLDYPSDIMTELIDGCNLKCRMCNRRLKGFYQNTNEMMTVDMFKDIIDERDIDRIVFGVNDEPLYSKNFLECLNIAKDNNIIEIKISTNGILMSEEIKQSIIDSKNIHISFSLDASTEETYKKIRYNNQFNRIKQDIKEIIDCRKNSFPYVAVSFVEMDINRYELNDFVNEWINIVDHVTFQICNDFKNSKFNRFKRCFQPFYRMRIRPNGNVYPCCSSASVKKSFKREMLLGNLNYNSIYELWHGWKIKHLRKTLIDRDLNGITRTCKYCMGLK